MRTFARARLRPTILAFGPIATACLIAGVAEGAPAVAPAAAPAPASSALVRIDPPAPVGSILPGLATEGATTVSKGHELLLTWLEPGAKGGRLAFSRFSGGRWLAPITVASQVSQIDSADEASLTVIETQGPRRTLVARTGDAAFRSPDGGRTWTRFTATPLPFSSFASGMEGSYVFWAPTDEKGNARLLATRVMATEAVMDASIAPRVPTAAAMTWDGPIVVYRDAGDRFAVVRRENARWSSPIPLPASRGKVSKYVDANPVIASEERRVAIAWVAERAGRLGVRLAFSEDAGRTFGVPVDLDQPPGAGVPDGSLAVALSPDGDAFLLWRSVETPRVSQLNLARVARDGRRSAEVVVAKTAGIHLRRRAQLVRSGEELVVAWNEGALARLRVGRIAAAKIPALRARAPKADPVRTRTAASVGSGRIGDLAPEFEFETLAGEKGSLKQLRGKLVVLNLWATWCVPCATEMPELAAIQQQYASRGVVVVGATIDAASRGDRVRAFVAERKLPFAIWLDPGMTLSKALRVPALPTSFLIDSDGVIVARRDRPVTAKELSALIDQELTAQ